MVSDGALALIKKRYCQDNRIPLPNDLVFTFFKVDTATGNGVFFISQPGKDSIVYTHERMDLSGYSYHRSLDIPADDRAPLVGEANPDIIAAWVNRFTNIDLSGEDISKLSLSHDAVLVIISPNSMRFKNSFQLKRL